MLIWKQQYGNQVPAKQASKFEPSVAMDVTEAKGQAQLRPNHYDQFFSHHNKWNLTNCQPSHTAGDHPTANRDRGWAMTAHPWCSSVIFVLLEEIGLLILRTTRMKFINLRSISNRVVVQSKRQSSWTFSKTAKLYRNTKIRITIKSRMQCLWFKGTRLT